jgi:hypothetical protein
VDLRESLSFFPVRGPVVLAAKQVVVDAGAVRLVEVNL